MHICCFSQRKSCFLPTLLGPTDKMEHVMLSRSALSFPITMVTFWLVSMAPRRAPRAWAKKPRNEFLGTAIFVGDQHEVEDKCELHKLG